MKKPDISVVIVNFNTKDDLKNCLNSVYRFEKNQIKEIIVVDNASSDGSGKMVQKLFPRVKLIQNRENKYFSAGYNQGLHIIQSKYVLVINSDILIIEQMFKELVQFMDCNPCCALVSCRQINQKGELNPTANNFSTPITEIMEMPLFNRFFKNHFLIKKMRLTNWDRISIKEVETAPGAFMFFKSSTLKEVGFLDENLKIYYSDQDISRRIINQGYKIFHYGKVSVIHLCAQTTKKIPLYQLMKIAYTDMLLFYRKYYPRYWQIPLYLISRLNLLYIRLEDYFHRP